MSETMGSSMGSSSAAVEKHLVVATFGDEDRALGVMQALLAADKAGTLAVDETAIVRKEDDGRISIKEWNDLSTGKGAGVGAAAGGLLGALFGKMLSGAVLGGLLGAGAAYVVDAGVSDARLKALGESLPNGSSAVAAIATTGASGAVKIFLEQQGGMATVEPVSAGATVNVPKTGVEQIDELTARASEAVQPFAQQAATTLSGAASSAEDAAQQVADEAKKAWEGLAGGGSSAEGSEGSGGGSGGMGGPTTA